jgi:hypothetical protein
LRVQEVFRLPLEAYAARHFPSSLIKQLRLWYESFPPDAMRIMIRRNVDRECDRNDILEDVWVEFLRRVAGHILPQANITARAQSMALASGSPLAECLEAAELQLLSELVIDPLRVIDAVLSDKTLFVLKGRKLPTGSCSVAYSYMRLEDFQKRHLISLPTPPIVHSPTGPLNIGLEKLVHWINDGVIDGNYLEGQRVGRPEGPTWCTNRSLIDAGCDATEIRNALGLQHIPGGFLVEVSYSTALLPEYLRAPTMLDGCAGGAGNWIFVKNRDPSAEPGFGYTAKLNDGNGVLQRGEPEAVHESFMVTIASAAAVQI